MLRRSESRTAFTLVELLVVTALIALLAGMALFLVPSISSDQQATQAGTQLQQWFEIAKQRAGRDRAPRGVRLLPGSTGNTLQVTELEYLEQPPDFWLGPGSTFSTGTITSNLPNSTTMTTYSVVNFTGGTTTFANGRNLAKYWPTLPNGPADPNAASYPVQPGDHITLGATEETHTIVAVSTNTAVKPNTPQLTLLPPALGGYVASTFGAGSTQYRIIRQPRPVGDDPLQMPQNIIIDVQPRLVSNGIYDLPTQLVNGQTVLQTPIDVMFSPDGRVIGPLAAYDKLIFWVRDKTVTPEGQGGDPALVCVYPRTGLIAACPVDAAYFISGGTASPYTFTTTGRRSSQ